MFKDKSKNMEFGVIGLGRFGFALAKTLVEAGRGVLAIDCDESKVKKIRNLTSEAFVLERLDRETLEETGIQNCGTVIVCIGEKLDVSILATLNLINMGIPRVISKAISFDQGCILEKLGAEVVYPENDMAIRVANRLLYSKALDFIELNNDMNICELKVTKKLAGVSVEDSKIRKKYKLNIIAIESNDNTTIIEITPEYVFKLDEVIVVIGQKCNIRKFEMFLNDGE